MWRILQQDKPDDYVVATGETHSVREFCEITFKQLGINLVWKGEKGTIKEIGVDEKTGKTIIKIDERYFRPTEVEFLLGDPSKAEKNLGWKREVSFEELVKRMVDNDFQTLEKKFKK